VGQSTLGRTLVEIELPGRRVRVGFNAHLALWFFQGHVMLNVTFARSNSCQSSEVWPFSSLQAWLRESEGSQWDGG
jgi:hypothetical protein